MRFPTLRGALVTGLASVLAAGLLAAPTTPAYAANPVTPGTFKGLGFDQCEAPSQSAMSAWIRSSPFRAAGIYISGNSRACRRQTNLTSGWVQRQLTAGWHLMPITLGPQASCSTRFPRYGASIDPTINPSSTNTYAAARTQAGAEARKAVVTARNLGIVAGSTLFYDIEGFSTTHSTACTWSALWFLSSWTRELHKYGYASGVYSSASSGIRVLDDARVRSGNQVTMPDQVWIADWNGRADTSSSYIRSDGWLPYRRAHQYRGGHNETWGGVTINIDRNYLDLRTPAIPGGSSTPPPPSGPAYTGTSTTDPKCTPTSISRPSYGATSASKPTNVTPLQCLLKQQLIYRWAVTGTWNSETTSSVKVFQRRVGHPVTGAASTSDWISAITASTGRALLKAGSTGGDVIRVQRAMNAATKAGLTVSGTYDTATANEVGDYQRAVGVTVTRTVGARTWDALVAGRH